MADNIANDFLAMLGQGIQAQANRPQKTFEQTTSTTRPIEYADILARRNQIGAERKALNDALKQRENFGYSFAQALANMPQQQGYGSWLGNAANAFGGAFSARTNAAIDRAQKDYEAAKSDLASALELDRALGTTQEQMSNVGYTAPTTSVSGVGVTPEVAKTAKMAYVQLDPNLSKELQDNPDAFSYTAREADIGSRTPEGGKTGIAERLIASAAKSFMSDKTIAARSRLLTKIAQTVGAVTNLARANGATSQMMNSDKEGQRSLSILSNPSAYTAEELAAANDVVMDLYDRMLTVSGLPTVEQGYQEVTNKLQEQRPQGKAPDLPAGLKWVD